MSDTDDPKPIVGWIVHYGKDGLMSALFLDEERAYQAAVRLHGTLAPLYERRREPRPEEASEQ